MTLQSKRRPVLLVDQSVLDGSAAALPLAWLDGFDLRAYPARHLAEVAPSVLGAAEALLVRSMTRVAERELATLRQLEALATLSSGTDHLDVEQLSQRGVALFNGHGGNARAVADWVGWSAHRLLGDLRGRDALVIGVGAVGSLVADLLQSRGARVWLCDPPRARRDRHFASCELNHVPPCALVTLHVPLNDCGDRTQNLWNDEQIARHPGAVVLQASRGGVADEEALTLARRNGHLAGLAIDTWVGEPAVSRELLKAADLATPHIAGHSIAGKLDVAFRAVRQLRAHFGLPVEPWLASAISKEEARWGGAKSLQVTEQLDAISHSLRQAPERFEALRHQHKRTQS